MCFLKRRLIRLASLAIGLSAAAACAPAPPRLPESPIADAPARLRVQVAGRTVVLALEQYVLGAALSEVTPIGERDAVVATVYEVQAIIARTYATANIGRHQREGFDLCDKTHCQLYEPARVRTSKYATAARQAVVATTGRILRYKGRPAETMFHSDCGGHTTTPVDAWGGQALPYLAGGEDVLPPGTHRSWQFAASAQEWTAVLARDARTAPGGQVKSLRVTKVDRSGRAAEVEIIGTRTRLVSGSTFRAVVTADRGERSILSSRFTVSSQVGGFRIDGTGFGHGVGLCQVGAIARARRGDSVGAILGHYYPGAR